jgi:transcriptional regulator with XRE-family HTH domain
MGLRRGLQATPEQCESIARRRTVRGLTRAQLAASARVSPTTVTQVERGEPVDLESVARIAQALKLTPPDPNLLWLLDPPEKRERPRSKGGDGSAGAGAANAALLSKHTA